MGIIFLSGLNFDLEECTNKWSKRIEQYDANLAMPQTFEELVNGNFGDMCLFLFCLDPINIDKEITSLMSSAHVFRE